MISGLYTKGQALIVELQIEEDRRLSQMPATVTSVRDLLLAMTA